MLLNILEYITQPPQQWLILPKMSVIPRIKTLSCSTEGDISSLYVSTLLCLSLQPSTPHNSILHLPQCFSSLRTLQALITSFKKVPLTHLIVMAFRSVTIPLYPSEFCWLTFLYPILDYTHFENCMLYR